MKKKIVILIVFGAFLLSGCSQVMSVFVTFTNIDSNETDLQLHFEFARMSNDKKKSLDHIWVYRNDSLVLELENQDDLNDNLGSWDFPSIPSDFKVSFPDSSTALPSFNKTDDLRFAFLSDRAYGKWVYKPNYSLKQFRWLFDHQGKQKINIGCHYERWLGKDIISIESSQEFMVNDSTIYIFDEESRSIDFDIKYKNNPTSKLALSLKNKYKKGTILTVQFQADGGKTYSETIEVPDKSNIGIGGKYGDL